MDSRTRIALLIDADNVMHDNIEQVLSGLAKLGDASIRRAYGNWFDARLKRWEPVLRTQAIRPIQQFSYTKGKNATDMALVIDAISLLHTDRPDAFAVVSSDADFTPLVTHLRERGLPVYGYGRSDTPQAFVAACTQFEPFLETRKQATRAQKAEGNGLDAMLVQRLRDAVKRAGAGGDGWARVQVVRSRLGSKESFSPSDYGHATLSKLLKATGEFEFRNEGSPAIMVREKAARS